MYVRYFVKFNQEVMMVFWDYGRDVKRTLGIRDKQILYRNAKGKCENPACNKTG
jgi:hypothetical protein